MSELKCNNCGGFGIISQPDCAAFAATCWRCGGLGYLFKVEDLPIVPVNCPSCEERKDLVARIEQLKEERDGNWRYAQQFRKMFFEVEATLLRIKGIGFNTHPSWNCNKEFNAGWNACRRQVEELLEPEDE
jgi:hypothetical protein